MYFLFINRCLVHIMKANSRHNDVAPPSSPWQQEASHPYPKITCRCKQARCSTCHKCQRCGCTCNKHGVSVGNNRSCRKLLELPRNCDHSIPTKSHHNNSTSRKRRGRPPKNKRVLSDSTANNPLSPKSPTRWLCESEKILEWTTDTKKTLPDLVVFLFCCHCLLGLLSCQVSSFYCPLLLDDKIIMVIESDNDVID